MEVKRPYILMGSKLKKTCTHHGEKEICLNNSNQVVSLDIDYTEI
jgi:hypothetical protein